jgi:hypothetical protein
LPEAKFYARTMAAFRGIIGVDSAYLALHGIHTSGRDRSRAAHAMVQITRTNHFSHGDDGGEAPAAIKAAK